MHTVICERERGIACSAVPVDMAGVECSALAGEVAAVKPLHHAWREAAQGRCLGMVTYTTAKVLVACKWR